MHAEVIQRVHHRPRDGVIAEVLRQIVGECIEILHRGVVDVFNAIDQFVDEPPVVELVADGGEEGGVFREDQPQLAEQDGLYDVGSGQRGAWEVGCEDEDSAIREWQEVDDVRVEAGPHVEDDVLGVELIDGGDELRLVCRTEIRDFVDQMKRPGHESEIGKQALTVHARVQHRHATVQRLTAPEEVIEVFGDGNVDGVADRRCAGVEVDQDRLAVTGKRERKVDRERRLTDATLSGRYRDDALDCHSEVPVYPEVPRFARTAW